MSEKRKFNALVKRAIERYGEEWILEWTKKALTDALTVAFNYADQGQGNVVSIAGPDVRVSSAEPYWRMLADRLESAMNETAPSVERTERGVKTNHEKSTTEAKADEPTFE